MTLYALGGRKVNINFLNLKGIAPNLLQNFLIIGLCYPFYLRKLLYTVESTEPVAVANDLHDRLFANTVDRPKGGRIGPVELHGGLKGVLLGGREEEPGGQ